MMNKPKRPFLLFCGLVFSAALCAQSSSQLFDFGWKFIEKDVPNAQDPSFDDTDWMPVDLPHDWDIAHSPQEDAATGNGGGYFPAGTGWYRKSFAAPALSQGETCRLHFDGVYQRPMVYLNGQLAGTHGYGFTPFSIDITPLLKEGTNTVAVKVDNSQQKNCRWYTGSGIYRHVWLETFKEGVMDDPEKLFVCAESLANLSADRTEADATIRIEYDGKLVERRALGRVKLWSPEHPVRYDVKVGSLTVKIGLRECSFSAAEGFSLNGEPMHINGACMHHDDGVLGSMAFDAAEFRKVKLMKEAGFNLIRTSHNPPSRSFLDACDSLGMMVLDEAFDGWYQKKTDHDYSELIDSCYQEDISAMVRRDRNHPCVICWSIGNEITELRDIKCIDTAKKLKRVILSLDTTRPVTMAIHSWDGGWGIYDPLFEVLDIVGYNYHMDKGPGDHERYPNRVVWQTESYPGAAFSNWKAVTERPYTLGDIVWTGLDYLGESGIGISYYEDEPGGEHYARNHFPYHGAYCGDVDITGWRKPISHYRSMLYNVKEGDSDFIYMAVREPNEYAHHGKILPTYWSVWPTWESWNWSGWEGKQIEVEIYSKSKAVNLYLNGKLLGTKQVDVSSEYKAVFSIAYQPGTLRAVAVDANGKEYASYTLTTSGEPYAIRLTPDSQQIKADGEDLSYVTIEVVDKQGRLVPDATIPMTIEVSGSGKLLAASSANFKDLEPKTSNKVTTYMGRAIAVVRSAQKSGRIAVTAKSGLKRATTKVNIPCK